MKEINSLRVLWLLNHTTLRTFEMAQFNSLGIKELYLPKFFPLDEGNLSASIDYSYDETLTIPKEDLALLNKQNWYEYPTQEAWDVANKYFDIAVIGFFPDQIKSVTRHFQGAIVLRAFGLAKDHSYTKLLYQLIGHHEVERIKKIKSRFWFGAGYEHLQEIESPWLKSRNCYLPVGLKNTAVNNRWVGGDKRILFVCPRINTSSYFKNIYQQFVRDFGQFHYTIAGAQPIPVNDERVIGFVSDEIHEANMRNHGVMYYHSTEPYHIHFHPFEAIRAGMPLVFMAGGLLDKIGGMGLWGRSETLKQAQNKIQKVLNDNGKLIKRIQKEQVRLLEAFNPDNCFPHFKKAYTNIIEQLFRAKEVEAKSTCKRIAVILPVAYRGGTLRGTISLVNSLINSAGFLNEQVEVVFAYLEHADYTETMFAELDPKILRRSFTWKVIDKDSADRAMIYAGYDGWTQKFSEYIVPDDGINYFCDCDVWLIISDRLEAPLLPIRPYILKVYDYIQRYIPFLPEAYEKKYISNAHDALCVLTTTEFTAQDATQYTGLESNKVFKMPMLIPDFKLKNAVIDVSDAEYFVWTTNLSYHKNHINTFLGLKIYYEELDGMLPCHITGVNTHLLTSHYPDLENIIQTSQKIQKKILFCGELSDYVYLSKLKNAAFLMHSAVVDNGTFSVIEAAQNGVPSISADYPPMREIDKRFNLGLSWMNGDKPQNIADNLKIMEKKYVDLKQTLSQKNIHDFIHTREEEIYYWEVIKKCL